MTCRAALVLPVERRPGNALNLEVGAPMPRCPRKLPAHWPATASALNWVGSGGSPLVFGVCDGACDAKDFAPLTRDELRDMLIFKRGPDERRALAVWDAATMARDAIDHALTNVQALTTGCERRMSSALAALDAALARGES